MRKADATTILSFVLIVLNMFDASLLTVVPDARIDTILKGWLLLEEIKHYVSNL